MRILGIFAIFSLLTACDDTATSMVVKSGYADASVYRVWYGATLVAEVVPPGAESAAYRIVPGAGTAYALVIPTTPSDDPSPSEILVMRSAQEVETSRGQALQLVVDAAHFYGDCAADSPLSQEDADFITQRIFPGPFAGKTYDAATCTLSTNTAGSAGGAGGGRP